MQETQVCGAAVGRESRESIDELLGQLNRVRVASELDQRIGAQAEVDGGRRAESSRVLRRGERRAETVRRQLGPCFQVPRPSVLRCELERALDERLRPRRVTRIGAHPQPFE